MNTFRLLRDRGLTPFTRRCCGPCEYAARIAAETVPQAVAVLWLFHLAWFQHEPPVVPFAGRAVIVAVLAALSGAAVANLRLRTKGVPQ